MFFQNDVRIDGNLCGDIEIKETQKGIKYCRFSVCYNEGYKNPQTNEWENKANFFKCIAWNKTAENCSKFQKGDLLNIIGKLTNPRWTDENQNVKSDVQIEVKAIRKISCEKSEPAENVASSELDEIGNEAFDVF